jgi:HK97 family phage prohead protease
MNTLDFGLELKEVSDEGTITGYGAVFGNVDESGDRIVPGAFAKSLAKRMAGGATIPMLWSHDTSQPIGMFPEMVEDKKGLKVTGKLVLEVPKAREALALLKAGAIRGMSIGYRTLSDAIEGNVRLLKEVDLWEVSLTTFPANTRAGITSVKSVHPIDDFARRLRDGEPPETKEFEDILREAGVPKALAVQIASVGYAKAIRRESEGKASELAIAALRDAARAFGNHRT